jgi:hypothetical protein
MHSIRMSMKIDILFSLNFRQANGCGFRSRISSCFSLLARYCYLTYVLALDMFLDSRLPDFLSNPLTGLVSRYLQSTIVIIKYKSGHARL